MLEKLLKKMEISNVSGKKCKVIVIKILTRLEIGVGELKGTSIKK